MDERKTDLPPGFDLLWGVREQGRRGPRPNLSVEQIVDAAIEIAQAEGLGPLSMAKVGERLGRSAMSLYRYVRNKDELLVLMMDVAALKSPPPEPEAGAGWRANLERWAYDLVALYRRYPWLLHAPIGPTPPIGPGQLGWLDRGLACFRPTNLPPDTQIGVVMLVLTFIRGQVRMAQEFNQSFDAAGGTGAGFPTYADMLRQFAGKDRFPALAAIVESGVFDDPLEGFTEQDFDMEVRFGFAMIFDGIERLVDAHALPAD